MNRNAIYAAVADERRQIASLIDALDDAQLASPSLCGGWDVKTVAAHLVSVVADGFWTFQAMALRRRGVDRAIDELARRRARLPPEKSSLSCAGYADRELCPPITGPRSGLTDVLVHGGDIRIPLGLPFAPRSERVTVALDFLTGPLPWGFVPRRRLRGICLCANDIHRSWGAGHLIPWTGGSPDDGRRRPCRDPSRARRAGPWHVATPTARYLGTRAHH